jgi:hypothetical protein
MFRKQINVNVEQSAFAVPKLDSTITKQHHTRISVFSYKFEFLFPTTPFQIPLLLDVLI